MKRLLRFVRTTIAGGLLFLVPFVVLFMIAEKALAIAHDVVAPLVAVLPKTGFFGLGFDRILAIGLLLFTCAAAGLIARTLAARKTSRWLESTLLAHMPGYESIRNRVEKLLGNDPDAEKWDVVLAEFNGSRKLGFLIERLQDQSLAIFVPDAPSGRTGEVIFIAPEKVARVEASRSAALKCLKRMGIGAGSLLSAEKPAAGGTG